MSAIDRMKKAFQLYSGGLTGENAKADVGDAMALYMKEGYDIMAWADPFMPDFSMKPAMVSRLTELIASPSAAHYTAPVGNARLKEVIAEKLKSKNGLSVQPGKNIIITPGSDAGLFFAMAPFLGDGDEVLIPCPSYPNNFQNAEIMGAVPVKIPLKAENGYQLDISLFEAALTPRTKMVVLTHPNNPTTTVFNAASLEALRDFVVKNDLVLVVDQAFEDHIYDGREFITPAAMEGLWERTVTVFSVSKGFGLSGLRVGYNVAPTELMDKYFASAVAIVGAASTIAQEAMIEAFGDPSYMDEFYEAFERRRRVICELLSYVPKIKVDMPESGFLLWIDVSQLGGGAAVCKALAQRAKVIVNDGAGYGDPGCIRIVIGVYKDDDRVYGAMKRVAYVLTDMANAKK